MYYYQKLIVFTLQLVLEVLSGTSSNSMNKIYFKNMLYQISIQILVVQVPHYDQGRYTQCFELL